jgi:hypothetical protein
MELFKKGLYSSEAENKFILPLLDKIEEITSFLKQFPPSDKVRLFPESVTEQWIQAKDHEHVIGSLIYEIYNRIKFLFYTSIFKAAKLSEALVLMYNTRNYLGWTLIGRSVIEHSAVLYYFSKKLQNINLFRNIFKISELEQIENALIQYSHGSRFDWDTLLSANISKLTKDYNPTEDNKKAVNISTALSHLSKKSELFKGTDIIYSMFSDFAHPNMASHSVFINLTPESIQSGETELSLDVNNGRGKFIIIATLETITNNLANIISLITEISKIMKFWLDNVVSGQVEINFNE